MPIERTPVNLQEPQVDDPRYEDSIHAMELVADYYEWAKSFLGLHTNNPYVVTPKDIQAKRRESQKSIEQRGYETGRGVHQIALLVNSTVKELESEFGNQSVLDIGCGAGRFGEAIARNAKAKVTFLDVNEDMLSGISPRAGTRILGDGRDMSFIHDESFDKAVTAFSSVFWAETPIESVRALNEAIRVTKIGGSTFVLPLFSNTAETRYVANAVLTAKDKKWEIPFLDQRIAHDKVTAAQAYALIRSLLNMSNSGYIAITWIDHKGMAADGRESDHISAIIDKLESIPTDFYQRNINVAQRLTEGAS